MEASTGDLPGSEPSCSSPTRMLPPSTAPIPPASRSSSLSTGASQSVKKINITTPRSSSGGLNSIQLSALPCAGTSTNPSSMGGGSRGPTTTNSTTNSAPLSARSARSSARSDQSCHSMEDIQARACSPIPTGPLPELGSKTLDIAPMLDVTTREFRFFMRLLSKRLVNWTEMVVDQTLCFTTNKDEHLGYDEVERPMICQLGGANPEACGKAAIEIARYGYDEINLNVGCPSDRVAGKGEFGASLMLKPEAVYSVVEAIKKQCPDVPVSVKTRIGVDHHDSLEFLISFIRKLEPVCSKFILHARKCILQGLLTPAQNRSIPPLNYERVFQVCDMFPHLEFWINGGIKTLQDARALCYGRIRDVELFPSPSASGASSNSSSSDEPAGAASTTKNNSSSSPDRSGGQRVAGVEARKNNGAATTTGDVVVTGSPKKGATAAPRSPTNSGKVDNTKDAGEVVPATDVSSTKATVDSGESNKTADVTTGGATATERPDGANNTKQEGKPSMKKRKPTQQQIMEDFNLTAQMPQTEPREFAPPNLMGVMLGRAAMDNPSIFWDVDRYFYGEAENPRKNRRELLELYAEYLERLYPKRCCDPDAAEFFSKEQQEAGGVIKDDEQKARKSPLGKAGEYQGVPYCHMCKTLYGPPEERKSKFLLAEEDPELQDGFEKRKTNRRKKQMQTRIGTGVVCRCLKPILGVFNSIPGNRVFRRELDELTRCMTVRECGPGYIVRRAMTQVPDEILDAPFMVTEELDSHRFPISLDIVDENGKLRSEREAWLKSLEESKMDTTTAGTTTTHNKRQASADGATEVDKNSCSRVTVQVPAGGVIFAEPPAKKQKVDSGTASTTSSTTLGE